MFNPRRIIHAIVLSALLLLAIASSPAQATLTAAPGNQTLSGPCLLTNTDHDWKCAHYRLSEVGSNGRSCDLTVRQSIFRWSCQAD